ncbi:MAG: hypothetical protein R3F62_07445 [Planctomycetota bacterium]
MSDLEALLDPTDPAARRRGLAAVLQAPEAPRQLERALFGLLDLGDAPLLAELARGLAPRADDPAARRVLEALTRAPGEARVPALRALRGRSPAAPGPRWPPRPRRRGPQP